MMHKYALLVVDMQEHFREMAEGILPQLNALIECAQRCGLPIYYTQHGHPNPEAEETTSVLVRWWGATGSIRCGSLPWQLLTELVRRPSDHLIQSKRTYNAFEGTELGQLLSEQGSDTVIVTGVMTHLCCETTARAAFTQNYNVCFLSDGNATSSLKHQKATLLNLADGFATVLSCAEMQALLEKDSTALAAEEQ